jgi:hypothetical protein
MRDDQGVVDGQALRQALCERPGAALGLERVIWGGLLQQDVDAMEAARRGVTAARWGGSGFAAWQLAGASDRGGRAHISSRVAPARGWAYRE